jgi:hypothetical protein
MGLILIGLGLTLIARATDLPDAASFGLAATLLLIVASGVAGTLASLAAHALGEGANSQRLARLGGLIQSMPVASASLAMSLLALSALPPGIGFATLWLLFQTILSAPRTGGLLSQLPLALIAAALALSSALATAASVRLIGIAILSRPRSVRGSAARDVGSGQRSILLTLGGIAFVLGAVPGAALKALADPAIRALTGTGLGAHAGWASLSAASALPGYSPLPVLALLTLATGSVVLVVRRVRKETRLTGAWNNGLAPSPGLPFGDPLTQSAGGGFLPTLPGGGKPAPDLAAAGSSDGTVSAADMRAASSTASGVTAASSAIIGLAVADLVFVGRLNSWLRRLPAVHGFASRRLPSAPIGLWVILLAFGALLFALSLSDNGDPLG